jgi:isoquinoline 1-oxidoreductase
MRKAGAAARGVLAAAAARKWGVGLDAVEVRDGAAVEKGGSQRLTYGDLAKAPELASAYSATVPGDLTLTPVKDWKTLGAAVPKTDGRDVVTGAHEFPSDIKRPGMLYGAVLRAPSYGAKLVSVDLGPAEKMEGVTAVRDGEFVGCSAPTSYAAKAAVEAIAKTAKWETSPHPSSTELFSVLKKTAVMEGDGRRGPRERTSGSLATGLAAAKKSLKSTYEVAYIQHVPMEPRAAMAEWAGGRLTVWTGTQRPNGVHEQLAEAFSLSPQKVRVIVPDTGGGFGGKHTGEVAIEAARLAKEAGKPVSLRWSRQEEFMWAYFRPAGYFELEAGLTGDGSLLAWDFANYNSGGAGLESPYKIPHTRTRFIYCDSPLREGSYRGIAATANHFVRESFMDELAVAAGQDPVAFRLANLENSRLRDVLEAAAKKFQFAERLKDRKPGRGVGIAGGTEKGSYVAACADVSTDRERGTIRVNEICMAFECGAIQNPGNLRAQIEGSIIQGLGGALTEEIRFENGKLLNGTMAQSGVPRFKDVPRLEIVTLNRTDLPSVGAGETPIVAVAPAIANAVFDATGVRVRTMPIRGEALKRA